MFDQMRDWLLSQKMSEGMSDLTEYQKLSQT